MGMKFDDSNFQAGMDDFGERFDAAVETYCKTAALMLQGIAQQNKPWKNRTGNATLRLRGTAQKLMNGFAIILAHGVDYGIHLELAHEKKYAILYPTVRDHAKDVVAGMAGILKAAGVK